MRKLLTIAILAVALSTLSAHAEEVVDHKVVYHMNGPDVLYHKVFLRNIQNHLNALGPENMQAEVIMHGPGLDLLMHARQDEQIQASIDSLKTQGVAFKVCNNTLVGRNIDLKRDLYDVQDSDIIPSGVAGLATRQLEGWAYIHP
ncbi:MAG: DsrE family protein [Halothiobacillaceae bacterium]